MLCCHIWLDSLSFQDCHTAQSQWSPLDFVRRLPPGALKQNAFAGKGGKLGKQCVCECACLPLSPLLNGRFDWMLLMIAVMVCRRKRAPPKCQKVSAVPLGKWGYVYFQPHCFLKNALAKSLFCLTSLACHICSFSHPVFNFVTICKHSYSPIRTNLITFEIGQKLLLTQ